VESVNQIHDAAELCRDVLIGCSAGADHSFGLRAGDLPQVPTLSICYHLAKTKPRQSSAIAEMTMFLIALLGLRLGARRSYILKLSQARDKLRACIQSVRYLHQRRTPTRRSAPHTGTPAPPQIKF
jgi:hypothetical protein